MTLRVIYDGYDFFGSFKQITADKEYADIDDLRKAFRALKKDKSFAMHIDGNKSLYWDTPEDFTNGVVTFCNGTWNNCSVTKIAFDRIKKELLSGL